jgi:hypothetical protein
MTEPTKTRELQRITATENLFRQVNERVKDLNERFGKDQGEPILVICECGRESCIDQIEMTVAEYEHIRSQPDLFAIKPEHAILDVERVRSSNERYWTVSRNL